MKHRIMVVDDHAIVLHGLKELINAEPDLTVALEAASAEEAMGVLEKDRPDLLITDISLPGLSGLDLIKKVQQVWPGLPSLVLSMHDEMVHGERAFRVGAKGYLVKQEATEKVITAIRKILAGEVYLPDRLQSMLLNNVRGRNERRPASVLSNLTDREFEIFRLIGHGMGASEIATKLNRSVKTVEAHRANLKQKLGLRNALELNRFAANWADREQY
ncbi:MAG: response regulator transcription factor [Betaproteobacteria bacterium]|nr:response regulator transcription factor [Betaproteobacteria bacterium]